MAAPLPGAVLGGAKLQAFLTASQSAMATAVGKVEVGFFETGKYPDGTPVAAVAGWQEFGTKTIPERPFFRQAIKNIDAKLLPVFIGGLKAGTFAVTAVLAGRLAEVVSGEIKRRITDIKEPPLAEATIRARARRLKSRIRSSNPLVDTGFMRAATSWAIDDGPPQQSKSGPSAVTG